MNIQFLEAAVGSQGKGLPPQGEGWVEGRQERAHLPWYLFPVSYTNTLLKANPGVSKPAVMATELSLFPVLSVISPSPSVARRGCGVQEHRWWIQESWLCLCTSLSLCKPELPPTATSEVKRSLAEKIKADSLWKAPGPSKAAKLCFLPALTIGILQEAGLGILWGNGQLFRCNIFF